MKLEVIKNKDQTYNLDIDGELIIENEKQLIKIVSKIEAYLKLRYLPEPDKKSFLDRLAGFSQ